MEKVCAFLSPLCWGEVMGQVVYRWVAWLLFKGCVVLKGTVGNGQLGR